MIATLESVVGRRDEVLSLLNEAYDEWGDKEYFRWKYDDYPDYEPDEHTFALLVDGEIAAFRRVFEKEIEGDQGTETAFVHGDAAVTPGHQGRGYYSDLYEKTVEYTNRSGAIAAITYNNVDNVTFEAKCRRGWDYAVLPLRLYVHSHETVLSQYADRALSGDSMAETVLATLGNRFVVSVDGERIPVGKLFGTESAGDRRGFEIGASPRAIARMIEAVSNESIARTVPTGLQLLPSSELSLIGHPGQSAPGKRNPDVETIEPSELPDAERDRIAELHWLSTAGAPTFRRERRDVDHMLRYPGAEVFVAREDDDLVGAAVVGAYENDGVHEARVLEFAAPSREIYRSLCLAIERHTAAQGYDLVVLVNQRDPGPEWASIDQQVMMWTEFDRLKSNKQTLENLQVSFYDVL